MPEAAWHMLKRLRKEIRQVFPESVPEKKKFGDFLPGYYVIEACYDETHAEGFHAHPDGRKAIRDVEVVSQNG